MRKDLNVDLSKFQNDLSETQSVYHLVMDVHNNKVDKRHKTPSSYLEAYKVFRKNSLWLVEINLQEEDEEHVYSRSLAFRGTEEYSSIRFNVYEYASKEKKTVDTSEDNGILVANLLNAMTLAPLSLDVIQYVAGRNYVSPWQIMETLVAENNLKLEDLEKAYHKIRLSD